MDTQWERRLGPTFVVVAEAVTCVPCLWNHLRCSPRVQRERLGRPSWRCATIPHDGWCTSMGSLCFPHVEIAWCGVVKLSSERYSTHTVLPEPSLQRMTRRTKA